MFARRSCLSVPGSSASKLAKAGALGADEVVIDLEDAVVAPAKAAARDAARRVVAGYEGGSRLALRVNPARSPWCNRDLEAAASAGPALASVVVPKVESPGDLEYVDRLLACAEAEAGRELPLRVQALVETAKGLARAPEIAVASVRVDALILGYADLATSLGRARSVDDWRVAQETVLIAARAAGVQAIDGPYLGIEDDPPFRAAAELARDLGFDGKWAIHPSQVPALNELFSPHESDVARARAVIAALDEAEAAGVGAAVLEGEMIDAAHRERAIRILGRAGVAA